MPSVVQHRSTFATSVTSVSLAYSSSNGAGNTLVYATGAGGTPTTVSAATDSNSNTIANATTIASGNAAGSQRVDYVANSKSGANTVTGHTSNGGDVHLHLWEISGCVTTSPIRATGTVSSSATASVSTSTSTPLIGDAVFAFFQDNPSNDALVAGSGYSPSELSSDSSGGDAALSEYKTATGSGTQTATCTGNGSNLLSQSIVVFIQAASTFVADEDFWRQGNMVMPDPTITIWQ